MQEQQAIERRLKKKQHSIQRTDHGYIITAPTIRGLVLSGGGAKGIAYAGMIEAMTERGFIRQLTHVSGASAGAMTASLLAIGMDHQDITRLISELDVIKLLDGSFIGRAYGHRFENMLEIMYMVQINKLLREQPRIEQDNEYYNLYFNLKMRAYEHCLSKEGLSIKSIEDIILLGNSPASLDKLDKAFKVFHKAMRNASGEELVKPRLTFADLTNLRSLLSADRQHLIKHLSVVATNHAKVEAEKLETYNETLNANHSIAEVVQFSGSHPLLFVSRQNENGDYMGDGGILDNMPSNALENVGLAKEEILCVRAVADADFNESVKIAQRSSLETVSGGYSCLDSILLKLVGGRVNQSMAMVANREKLFYQLGNMLFLNTGVIKTTSTKALPEEKMQAINTAKLQTNDLINRRDQTFEHPLLAALYVGIDELEERVLDELLLDEDQVDPVLVSAIEKAGYIYENQKKIAEALKERRINVPEVEEYIVNIIAAIRTEENWSADQQNKAIALCIQQVDHLSEGGLEHYLRDIASIEPDPIQKSWLEWILALIFAPIVWIISLFITIESDELHQEYEVPVSEQAADRQKKFASNVFFSFFKKICCLFFFFWFFTFHR